jgi:hypothetical protein
MGYIMNEHLIFYIDFIGFSKATCEWDEPKQAALIDLLHNLASLRSEFDFREQPTENGTTLFNIKPAITTFSDHIVISYPTEHIRKLGGDDYLGTALFSAQKLIGTLAAAAMSLGLLIRGGATVGDLHHTGGVVIGKAMIEAYELESRVAIYPRIAVSRKLYSQIKTTSLKNMVILEDYDGITYFNYFVFMILAGGGLPGNNFKQQLNMWLTETRRSIAENIDNLEKNERWNELAKWVWFKNNLERARAGLNNALFE